MNSKFFTIFKTLFIILLIAATATVIFAGCNLIPSKKGTTDKGTTDKGTADSGYTVPKETAEKQAIIDDWIANKALKIEYEDVDYFGIFCNDILFLPIEITNNHFYGDFDYYQKNSLLYSVKDGVNGEVKLYAKVYDRKEFMIYDSGFEDEEWVNKFDRINSFSYYFYYNGGGCGPIGILEHLFDRHFVQDEDGIFRVKKDAEAVARFDIDLELMTYACFFDVEESEREDTLFYFMHSNSEPDEIPERKDFNFKELYEKGVKNRVEDIQGTDDLDTGYSVQFIGNEIIVEGPEDSGTICYGKATITPLDIQIKQITSEELK